MSPTLILCYRAIGRSEISVSSIIAIVLHSFLATALTCLGTGRQSSNSHTPSIRSSDTAKAAFNSAMSFRLGRLCFASSYSQNTVPLSVRWKSIRIREVEQE